MRIACLFIALLGLSWSSVEGSRIENKSFPELKQSVSNYLKHSGCSAEKTCLMMDLILRIRPEVCVEVGVFTGASLLPVAATLKYLDHGTVYAIDAWSNSTATHYMHSKDPQRSWWASVDMKEVYYHYRKMQDNWKIHPFCKTLKMTSTEAAGEIGEIDFLHLDGDYTEKGSLKDVRLYLPKVKKGGYILYSNIFLLVRGFQPKLPGFITLLAECDIVAEIENSNIVLLRKR